MKLGWIMILATVAVSSGCAFAPQAVMISPTIDVQASEVGADHSVKLTVVDERPRKTLGTRGVQNVGADLTIQGDLALTIQNAIARGLAQQRFTPLIDSNPESRELRVEIRNLDYMMIMGFWAGTVKVDTSLKAICVRASQRPYEQLHRGEIADSVQLVQSAAANNSYVSQAVSAAVNSLLQDRKLLTCLSE
jgi:uncharacterized lipoprotein YajG